MPPGRDRSDGARWRLKDPAARIQRLYDSHDRARAGHVSRPKVGELRRHDNQSQDVGGAEPRLVVCDPHFLQSAASLSLPVPRGSSWSVSLLEVWLGKTWRVGAAFARRVPVSTRGVRWEQASFTDGNPSFGTDYGVATIVSAEFAASVGRDAVLRKKIETAVDSGGPNARLAVYFENDEGKKKAFRFRWFGSGLGDGRYEAFWQLDDAGEPLILGIDFDIPRLHELSEPHRAWHEKHGRELERF